MRDFKPHSKRKPEKRTATGLVLYRRPGQSICVGDDIRITVMETKAGSVKLCFDAPADVLILREELKDNPAE